MAPVKTIKNPRKIRTITHPDYTNYSLEVLDVAQYPNVSPVQSVWICRDKTRIDKLSDSPKRLEKTIRQGLKKIEEMAGKPARSPA